MLDLVKLKALIAVRDTGSITQAARTLQFTAPALSQQLLKLERDVGTQLLIRRSSGCELTSAGQMLVERAEGIFERVSEAEQDLALLTDVSSGRCVIGSFATAGVHLVPPVLAEFHRLIPGIGLSLQEFEPPEGLRALAEGHIDLTLSHHYSHGTRPPKLDGVIEETIATEAILAVAGRRTHLGRAPDPIDWRELAEHPLICGSPGLADRTALESVFETLGLGAPNVTHETANYDIAVRLAEESLGVALVPRMTLQRSSGALTAHSLTNPELTRSITIAWRERYPTTPVMTLRRLFKRISTLAF